MKEYLDNLGNEAMDESDESMELMLREIHETMFNSFSIEALQDPDTMQQLQMIDDEIVKRKTTRVFRGIVEEIENKTEDLNVNEIRNYFLKLLTELENSEKEDLEMFLHNEFEAIRKLDSEIDRSKYNAYLNIIEKLKIYSRKLHGYWKEYAREYEGSTGSLQTIPNSIAQKLMLVYELGIIDHLNERYQLDNNFSRIANILAVVIDSKSETIRKTISALQTGSDPKNNPVHNEDNLTWLGSIMGGLKLKLQKINK
ncbi:MAG: hypothetical protein JW776_04495 [Candidatus Lokiarchaeota archaeon]|nr:hypothetical protein [Candidatus Lokiarchaeota archaeon]